MKGDERRYAHLESPKGDSLFVAYDPQEMKLGKVLIVASSDYLYTPRSLFGLDVIFLTTLNLLMGPSGGDINKCAEGGKSGSISSDNRRIEGPPAEQGPPKRSCRRVSPKLGTCVRGDHDAALSHSRG